VNKTVTSLFTASSGSGQKDSCTEQARQTIKVTRRWNPEINRIVLGETQAILWTKVDDSSGKLD